MIIYNLSILFSQNNDTITLKMEETFAITFTVENIINCEFINPSKLIQVKIDSIIFYSKNTLLKDSNGLLNIKYLKYDSLNIKKGLSYCAVVGLDDSNEHLYINRLANSNNIFFRPYKTEHYFTGISRKYKIPKYLLFLYRTKLMTEDKYHSMIYNKKRLLISSVLKCI